MFVVGVIGMFSVVVVSIIEFIGDYYVCVWLFCVLFFFIYVINRGIFVEGFFCVFDGIFGIGNGFILFSFNIGVLGIIKVGSCCVI